MAEIPVPSICTPPEPMSAPDPNAECCDLMLGGEPVSVDNPVPVDVTLVVPDIEIGAVQIQDFATADQVHVNAGHEMSVTDAGTHTVLSSIEAGTPDGLGQVPMADSMPVVIASDQTPIPVTIQSDVEGLATTAKQDVGNASLAAIDAGIPAALGAAVKAASMPVTIASDQIVPISAAALPLPAGAATAANQATEIAGLASIDGHVDGLEALATTGNATLVAIDGHVDGLETLATAGNASLAAIDAGTPAALGQTTMANSQPVVLASDQTDVKVDLDKVAGTGTATASGAATAGTQRVILATDQPVIPIQGDVAAGVANSGNPIQAGGLGKTAFPTAVADGQRVPMLLSKFGEPLVRHALRGNVGKQKTTITNSVTETTIITADASFTLDVVAFIFANTGTATTAVSIRDATAGTVMQVVEIPAGETRGYVLPGSGLGFQQAAANNNWTAQCSVATTDLNVWALFEKRS